MVLDKSKTMQSYILTCLNCQQSDTITIDDDNKILFKRGESTNFLSGRYRQDMQWGFECKCGNDSRISKSEESYFDKLVSGAPMGIEAVRRSLKTDDSKKFAMVVA